MLAWWMNSCVNGRRSGGFSGSEALIRARDLPGNHLVDVMVDFLGGHADGVGDGAFAGRTVRFDDHAVEAEDRRPAIDFRINPALKPVEGAFGQPRAELADRAGFDFRLEDVPDGAA